MSLTYLNTCFWQPFYLALSQRQGLPNYKLFKNSSQSFVFIHDYEVCLQFVNPEFGAKRNKNLNWGQQPHEVLNLKYLFDSYVATPDLAFCSCTPECTQVHLPLFSFHFLSSSFIHF